MTGKNTLNPFGPGNPANGTALVDQLIGSAYDVVKAVALQLDTIKTLGNNIDEVVELASNLADIQNVIEHMTAIETVADNVAILQAINDNLTGFTILAQNADSLVTLIDDMPSILLVTAHMTEIQQVAAMSAQLQQVIDNIDDIVASPEFAQQSKDARDAAVAARNASQGFAQDANASANASAQSAADAASAAESLNIDNYYTKSEVDTKDQTLAERIAVLEAGGVQYGLLQWLGTAIGEYKFLHHSASAPPKDSPHFRYIELTAGLTVEGGYNENLLSTEVVTGTDPIIVATALLSDPTSPLNGEIVRLVNTSREFLRPGATVLSQNSQNLLHNHTGNTASSGQHTHVIPLSTSNGSAYRVVGAGAISTNNFVLDVLTQQSGAHSHVLAIDNDGGLEARPRYTSTRVFLRIR